MEKEKTTFPTFDSHFHIFDHRFPLIPNEDYLPSEFTVEDYLKRIESLSIVGGALISSSFQGFDQTYLIDALEKLGPSFVGIAQIPSSYPDEEILQLHNLGVRGIRFNIKRGCVKTENVEKLAKRVYEVAKWHSEFYLDSTDLSSFSKILLKLPKISIDHLGLSKKGFPFLLSLLEKGAFVKVSGFGRVDFSIEEALKEIAKVNPDGMMFGTDLPSTRVKKPFFDQDRQLILNTFDSSLSKKILFSNAAHFYQLLFFVLISVMIFVDKDFISS